MNVSYKSRDQRTKRGRYTTIIITRTKRCDCMIVLHRREKALRREHTSTLDTFSKLCNLYRYEGKLDEAAENVLAGAASLREA